MRTPDDDVLDDDDDEENVGHRVGTDDADDDVIFVNDDGAASGSVGNALDSTRPPTPLDYYSLFLRRFHRLLASQ